MKKGLITIILFLILSIFIIPLIYAQEDPIEPLNALDLPGLPTSGEVNPETGLPSEVDKLKGLGENLTDKDKREYLFQELKKELLKNKFIAVMDKFFTKISIVFTILFGEPYTLSGVLLIIIILWFYFFIKFSEIMHNYSAFSSGVAWVMGFAITVVAAQVQILRKIAEFFIWFTLYKEATWWRVLAWGILVVGMFLLYYLSSKISVTIKDKKKKTKIKQDLADLHEGAKTGKAITKTITKTVTEK